MGTNTQTCSSQSLRIFAFPGWARTSAAIARQTFLPWLDFELWFTQWKVITLKWPHLVPTRPLIKFALSILATLCLHLNAQNNSAVTNQPASQRPQSFSVSQVFHQAQTRHRSEPANAEAAWQFARACFDLAE